MKNEDGILLSEKYGVNPSLLHCFVCGKDIGVVLLGKLKDDVEAPRDMIQPGQYCDDCKKQIEAGNKFIIEVKGEEETPNPERTGNYVCVKGSAFPDIKNPVCYAPQEVFQKVFGDFLKESEAPS